MSNRARGMVMAYVLLTAMVLAAVFTLPKDGPRFVLAALVASALIPLATVGKSYADKLDRINREQLVLHLLTEAPELEEGDIRSRANKANPDVAMSPETLEAVLDGLANRGYVEGKVDGSDWRNRGIGRMKPVRIYRLTDEGKKAAQVARFWP